MAVPEPKMDKIERGQVNLCMIGSVDSGKTTLALAIEKVMRDRFACLESASENSGILAVGATGIVRRIKVFDCPSHANRLLHLTGNANRMDGAILIASLTDPQMFQARQQVLLASKLKLPCLAVFLNKAEEVGDFERLRQTEAQVRELLVECGYSGKDMPIVAGSAFKAMQDSSSVWADQIIELIRVINDRVQEPVRDRQAPFLMAIGDIFKASGQGSVVAVVLGPVESICTKYVLEMLAKHDESCYTTIHH